MSQQQESEKQISGNHDAHCWLTKGGHRWHIRRVTRDGFIFLRRPLPNSLPAYHTVDATRVDWVRYAARAYELLTA